MGDSSLTSGISLYARWKLQMNWEKIKPPTDLSLPCCYLYLQLTLDAAFCYIFLVINYKQKSINFLERKIFCMQQEGSLNR